MSHPRPPTTDQVAAQLPPQGIATDQVAAQLSPQGIATDQMAAQLYPQGIATDLPQLLAQGGKGEVRLSQLAATA